MSVTTLNYVDLAGVFDNLVEVLKEITREVGSILQQPFNTEAAYPFSRFESAVYPKWLCGLSDAKPEPFGISEDFEPYTILIELQIGKKTEGYDGQLERQLQTWIPYTLAAFRATPRLQTDANMESPLGLLETQCRLYKSEMPGDIIGAKFLLILKTFVSNLERD